MPASSDPQRVLITGCSSGFGRLTAIALAAAGHRVFATMRGSTGKNAAAAEELGADERITVLDLDVTDDASVSQALGAALEAAGGLDVVINNAGVAGLGFLEGYTAGRIRDLFEVNVFGAQRLCRAILPHFRAAGRGLIIFVSSSMGRVVIPCAGPYTASKFALEALAESYRYELAPLGVDVSIVQPGTHPTAIGGKMAAWSNDDPERVADYGAAAPIPGLVQGSIIEALSSPTPPDSGAVVQALVDIIASPAGARPLRVVIDELSGAGVTMINEASAQVQGMALAGLNLKQLCTS